jgi:release factor glutamine methyltransferase
VSNPPYITEKERLDMEANVLDYEPHTALFVPDNDPLLFYRAITLYAKSALAPGGRLYFEINQNFGKETEQLLDNNGFTNIAVIKDMYANDRFVSATKPLDK